ncbi:unnamed protein product [Rotaria sordida]|uniref:Uncharacterized protein n=1 Tax=Rotaria sordida TaxID=392033 RepID=A0A815V7N7_9BILA|nr:unnamed protein product [Rotaria sordida]CAF1524388.1 unnamed protein product [Rotaria sordida]
MVTPVTNGGSKSSSTTTSSKPNDDDSNNETTSYSDSENEEDSSDNDYISDDSNSNDYSNDSPITYLSTDEELPPSSDEDENENTNDELPLSQSNINNQRQTNDELIIELISNTDSLILFIYNLLQRVRCLISFIKKSYPLDRYIRHQIHLKNIEIKRYAQEQKTKPIKLHGIVMDFRIRWNTTYVMLSRFIAISSIITDVTLSPSIEIVLKNVLFPFYRATKLLSGSKYPTLSIGYSVLVALKNFLTTAESDEALENAFKKLLLIQFNYYFEEETSLKQKHTILVRLTV